MGISTSVAPYGKKVNPPTIPKQVLDKITNTFFCFDKFVFI